MTECRHPNFLKSFFGSSNFYLYLKAITSPTIHVGFEPATGTVNGGQVVR